MSGEKYYWKWKNTIIDFNTISDEKDEYSKYRTKKDIVFRYLGTPDKDIHEWYNGGWSSEYNTALRYAKELDLVEDYIDYDDKLFEKDKEIERLNNIIKDIETYIHLWKLEEIGEKTMLILNDILLIKNGMSDEVVRLKDSGKDT